MKRYQFAIVAALFSGLIAVNEAHAQNSINIEVPEPGKNFATVERVATNREAAAIGVKARALKDFSKAYKTALGESWEKTNEGFAAKFSADGVRTTVYYSNSGNWVGSLKGYNEDKMPADVRKTVKREYFDYNITYVQEAETIDSESKPTYIVHLEDKNSIKIVKVYDGVMEAWQEYKKQS